MLTVKRLLGQETPQWISKFSLILAGFALTIMTLLIVIEVVGRNLFNASIPFAIEYAEYLIPAVALWGAAYALSIGAHVRADVIVSHLPSKIQLWLILLGYIVGLAFVVILDTQTCVLVSNSIKMHRTSLYPLRTPLGYAQLILPIGLSLFALQIVVEIVRKAKVLFLSYR